jgi:hypothetical protein
MNTVQDIKLNPIEKVNLDPPEFFDILSPLKDFLKWIVEQVMSLANTLVSFITERIIKPIVDAFNWVLNKIVEFFKNLWESVLRLLKGIASPITPDKVIESIPMIIATYSIIILNISGLLSAIGTQIMGTKIEVEPIAKTLHSLLRPSILVSFTLGAILGLAIREPISYWAKKYFRPLKPDPITLFGLYTRGYITREQLRNELAYVTGYPDNYIDGLIDIFEYNPSLFDLLRMADYVELTDEFIRKSLTILGVKEPYFSILFTLIKKRPLREEIRTNVSQLITAYSKGYISRTFLIMALDNLGLQPKEKELMLMYADNKRTYEIIEERIYILRTAYQKGLIDKSTLDRELTKLGLDREWINLIISRGDLFRKIEIPIPKITRGFTTEIPFSVSYSYTLS